MNHFQADKKFITHSNAAPPNKNVFRDEMRYEGMIGLN
jgi:hypothetical protein